MIWALVNWLWLRRLRERCPELFDGEAARRNIEACVAESMIGADQSFI